MAFDLWLAFVAASVALLLLPGPNVMLVLGYALSHGRRVAMAMALGVAVGDFLALTASLFGLGALVQASAELFAILKWTGAVYLVWLGVKLLRSGAQAAGPEAEQLTGNAGLGPGRIFAHAASVSALNPKSIAFFIAFVPQFLRPAEPLAPQFATLIVTYVTLAALTALGYALLADRLRLRIREPAVLRWINRVSGGALIGMGLLTATLRRG